LLVSLLVLATMAAPAHGQVAAVGFSGAAAKLQVDALAAQIGSRPAGSANYDRAVQYAADQLRQWGYQPTLQTFPIQTYDDRGSSLTATASGSLAPLELSTDTLVYSTSAEVEAPLAAAGLGTPADVAAGDVRGKI